MVYQSGVIKLNNGQSMPQVGLGCWKIPKEATADQVYHAIQVGYRLFDGAEDYGNETEVGQGIGRAINEGLVKREDLFIISKLWCNYHHPKHVRSALRRTLQDLGLEYLDLYYMHFPIAFKYVDPQEKYPPGLFTGARDETKHLLSEQPVTVLETYRELEKLVDEGLVKSIGVSNFQGSLLQDLLRGARIRPAALQIELHPYLTQERLVHYAQSQGIAVVAYSSFGPQSFLELGSEVAKGTVPLLQHDLIKSLATKYSAEPAQVLLRWATQRGIAVIPKSSKKERLLSNLRTDGALTLSEADCHAISDLNKNLRFNDPWDWKDQRFPTFV